MTRPIPEASGNARSPVIVLKGEQAQRVHVGGRTGGFAADLLGGQVGGRPDDGARSRVARAVGEVGDAEVGELRPVAAARHARLREEDVRGLDVAMDDPGAMHDVEGRGELPDQARRLVGIQWTVLQSSGERLTLDELHHEVLRLAGHDLRVVEGHERGMVQRGQQGHLGARAGQDRRVLGFGAHDLDRDGAPEDHVVGSIHPGHPALTDAWPEDVPPIQHARGHRLVGWFGHGHSCWYCGRRASVHTSPGYGDTVERRAPGASGLAG